MITEKFMMPYVLSAQHKVVHLAMMCTQLVIYLNMNDENNHSYMNIRFVDLFASDLSDEQSIMKSFFVMFFVHIVSFTIDFIIDFIEKKWQNKSVSSAQNFFKKDEVDLIDKSKYATKNLLAFKIILYFMSIIFLQNEVIPYMTKHSELRLNARNQIETVVLIELMLFFFSIIS